MTKDFAVWTTHGLKLVLAEESSESAKAKIIAEGFDVLDVQEIVDLPESLDHDPADYSVDA